MTTLKTEKIKKKKNVENAIAKKVGTAPKKEALSTQLSIDALLSEVETAPLKEKVLPKRKKVVVEVVEVVEVEVEEKKKKKEPVKRGKAINSQKKDEELEEVLKVTEESIEIKKEEKAVEIDSEEEIVPTFIVPYEIDDQVVILSPPLSEMDKAAENYYYRKDYEKKTGTIKEVFERKKVYYSILIGSDIAFFYHHEINLV